MTITKEEFEALPDAVKSLFKASGDGYEKAEAGEDVEGLKRSKAEILAEKKSLQAKLAELEKFKADQEAEKNKAEEEILAKKGEFDTILAQKEKAWQERIDAALKDKDTLLSTLKTEQIKNLLTSKGILPDRVKAALAEGDFDNLLELETGESGFALKKKGGIGDAAEMDAMFNDLKGRAAYLFESKMASGSGANGSGQNNGTGKTMARAAFSALPPAEQMAFSKSGGTLTD